MLVYTLVFSVYLRIDMESYPAFLFSGLLPWMWLSSSLQQGVTSILDNAGIVTRSQFPTEILPVVTLTANTVNFLFTLPLVFAFLVAFQVPLGLPLLLLPALVVLEYLLALGLVLIVSAVNIYFRDLQHIMIHLLTVLLFLTPVFYPVSLVPEWLRPWALLNPLAILMSAFQDVLVLQPAAQRVAAPRFAGLCLCASLDRRRGVQPVQAGLCRNTLRWTPSSSRA